MDDQMILEKVINHRRYLHMYPELGRNEFNTQQYILNCLKSYGYEISKVETGVVADLIIDENLSMIGLRADIDALPINELNDISYKSKHEGVMHGCGHDGHTAILLVVAETLQLIRNSLNVNIRLIFQHDEEDQGGAEDFCDLGYMNEVEAIFGLHIDNNLSVGEIGIHNNQVNAGGDEFEVKILGENAHGAYPELGIDTIVCASNIIMSLQQIVSRKISALDSTVITVGKISGGTATNVIAGQTSLSLTMRNLNMETRNKLVPEVINTIEWIAKAYDCHSEIEHTPSYPPLINNAKLVSYVTDNVNKLGLEYVYLETPTMGLEDFAYYASEVPGAFFKLGSKMTGGPRNAHSEIFDFDEKALLNGVKLQIQNCINYEKNVLN